MLPRSVRGGRCQNGAGRFNLIRGTIKTLAEREAYPIHILKTNRLPFTGQNTSPIFHYTIPDGIDQKVPGKLKIFVCSLSLGPV